MATYYCVTRTNYFHVKDAEAFRMLMSRVYGSTNEIQLWETSDNDGKCMFGFGTYGEISGLKDDDPANIDDSSYDDFLDALQSAVADDDAIIILESGHENLRYLTGRATIITTSQCQTVEIQDVAQNMAAQFLQDESWTTTCIY